ncbi:MAG TPA: bifunctional shikimate kinase/3-dehydroquinate synthase [Gaiellaceae bacterium]|nr:bifunctional shikimate kinase/3-dehydroquinate synthase [Gaiellaceae bacterium]
MTAVGRHLALVGFMGAGKSTLGELVAERLGRPFVDLDREVERQTGTSIEVMFAHGEEVFRDAEERIAAKVLRVPEPAVIALGGGAVLSAHTRSELARHLTVMVDVDVDTAWERVRESGRPLARDDREFRILYEARRRMYEEVADARADDPDGIVLAAGAVEVDVGAFARLGELTPGEGRVALVTDRHVAGIYGADAQLALGARLASEHELPPGEEAKRLAVAGRLWDELAVDRTGTVLALGGGCVTDAAGFVAATHLRGVPWVAVPTTLVGQVDAAIGGKTGLDTATGKNRIGAFHWPARTVIDPAFLETLSAAERRAGMAEVAKTGLLAGEQLWELPDPELVRRAAAFKTAVCLRDPTELGERAILNLGHTFGHALEAAGGYRIRHGDAVALGLTAALELSERRYGLDPGWQARVRELLDPQPIAVDREAARRALVRDKKAVEGRPRLVLLEAPGRPVVTDDVPLDEVHAALDALVSG